MQATSLMEKKDKDIGWIETFSGKKFYLSGTDTKSICIEDIAHALANICRYNGHANRFYSVAEHSVIVSYAVPRPLALWGLMHDASEAYLSDIPRPFKAMIANYKQLEAGVMGRICVKYNLAHEEPAVVKNADSSMLYIEARNLMNSRGEGWEDFEKYKQQFYTRVGEWYSPRECLAENLPAHGKIVDRITHIAETPWGVESADTFVALNCWTPDQAKSAFMTRFLELNGY